MEDKLAKLCRMHGEKAFFEEGFTSYYQTYSGPAEAVIYFKNKFMNKAIGVEVDITMTNM